MRIQTVFLLAVLVLGFMDTGGSAQVSGEVHPLFLSHLSAGAGDFAEIVLTNQNPYEVTVSVGLVHESGSHWGNVTGAGFYNLASGESQTINVFKTTDTWARESGWLYILGWDSMCQLTPRVTGKATWWYHTALGELKSQETELVFSSHAFSFSSLKEDSGIALLNTGKTSARIYLQAVDADGETVGDTIVELSPFEKVSKYVWEYFPELGGGFTGSVFVGTGGQIVANAAIY